MVSRILRTFEIEPTEPPTTSFFSPDGSFEIRLPEPWTRGRDENGELVLHLGQQTLWVHAGDPDDRIRTCAKSVGPWEACGVVRAGDLEQLTTAIRPEPASEHGGPGPVVDHRSATVDGEEAVVVEVEAYEYPARGAEFVTYVALMHEGRPYIIRAWTPHANGIFYLDAVLAGFRFLD
jgi:hypothetical protein